MCQSSKISAALITVISSPLLQPVISCSLLFKNNRQHKYSKKVKTPRRHRQHIRQKATRRHVLSEEVFIQGTSEIKLRIIFFLRAQWVLMTSENEIFNHF